MIHDWGSYIAAQLSWVLAGFTFQVASLWLVVDHAYAWAAVWGAMSAVHQVNGWRAWTRAVGLRTSARGREAP